MIKLMRTICICIFSIVPLQDIGVHAATYYVATTGNNGNPGTSSQPWRTVAYAVSRMGAGDTTYVKGGTYKEGVIRFGRSGTQAAPIKLLNAPGEFPVIDCIDKTQAHRILLQNSAGYQKAIGWITIEGFEIRNCYNGIKFYNANNFTVRRNWIHHNTYSALLGNGVNVLIDRNRINRNGRFAECAASSSVCGLDHGIYASGRAFTITNNLIHDNLAFGIQVAGAYAYDPAKYAGPEYALTDSWIIANNTLAYSNNNSGIVLWGSTCNNARIENNIFYENAVRTPSHATQGISFVAMGSKGISIRNNLAFASGSGGTAFLGLGATQGVHYTQSGNIVNTMNPGFISAPATTIASPNFALASNSPAINKGLTTTTKIAYNAISRPQGTTHDIGAYEYYAGGTTSQLLIAPTSATAK